MRIWKRLLNIALCLCALCALLPSRAAAAPAGVYPRVVIDGSKVHKEVLQKKDIAGTTYAPGKQNSSSTAKSTITESTSGQRLRFETALNKLSELYFIPFTTSLTVPAYTTCTVKQTFHLNGAKQITTDNRATSAASFQLLYFGEEAPSGTAITPRTEKNKSYGASNGSMLFQGSRQGKSNKDNGDYNTDRNINLESCGNTNTLTLVYKNTTGKEKTISYHFAFWGCTQYGSTYNNRFLVEFTTSYEVTSTEQVNFAPTGGTVSRTSKTVTYGDSYGSLPTPTRPGYTFDGWFTAKTGGEKITSTSKVTTFGVHTLYARWTPRQYTVTFDSNGGTVSTTSKTVTYGETYASPRVLPEPTYPGHTFDGWYTTKTGGTRVTEDTVVTVTEDHTLYARWHLTPAKEPTGIHLTTNQTILYGKKPWFSEGCATDTGHTISWAWYECSADGSNGKRLPKRPEMPTAGVHYYYAVAIATRKDNSQTASARSEVAKVTVNKATPMISTKPTSSTLDLAKSTALSGSRLTGGIAQNRNLTPYLTVPGTFAWKDGNTTITKTGPQKFTVLFTPEDTDNYNSTEIEVSVQVQCTHNYKMTGETPATCTKAGMKTYTCTACNDKKTETLSALEHSYGKPTYVWNRRNCTAERKCSNDNSHKETETVTAAVETTRAATCTLEELSTYTATFTNPAFNKQKKENVVTANKLGHAYAVDFTEDKPATCTENGSKSRHCSRCDAKTDETVIPPTGHTGGTATIENNIAATCTTDGSHEEVVRCMVCNAEISRETKTIPATGHKWVIDAAVAPTCTQTGLTEGKHCSVCNTVLTPQTTLPALGHKWNDGVVTREPTCTEDGVNTFTCAQCHNTKTERIPAPGHQWSDWVVTTAATEETEGSETRTCQRDDTHTETRSIPKLDHTHTMEHHPAVDANCGAGRDGNSEYWVCSGCGKFFRDAGGKNEITRKETVISPAHAPSDDWSYDESSHWHECKKCRQQFDFAAHVSSGPATETDSKFCTVCGYVIQTAASHTHNFSCQVESETYLKAAATCTNGAIYYKSCVCGEKGTETFESGSALGHAGGTATCQKKAVCTVCNQEYGELGSHDYDTSAWGYRDADGHAHLCQTDGCKEHGTIEDHVYDGDSDPDCNTCGYVRTSVHTCGNATPVSGQAPGCTMNGWKGYYQCSCGRLYTTADCTTQLADLETWKSGAGRLAASGHDFTVQEYDNTQHWTKCSRCDAESTRENHSGGAATCQAKAVCDTCGQQYGDYANHEFDTSTWGYKDADGHAHRCRTNGCTAHDTVNIHISGGQATETTPEICTECGYIIRAALGHTHSWMLVSEIASTCIHTGTKAHYKCSGCPQLATEADGVYTITDDTALGLPENPANHAGEETEWVKTETTHTETYKCCNAVKTAEAPHSGGTANCQVRAICAICGQTYGEFGAHDYDTSVWGYKEADGHAHSCQAAGCTTHDVLAAHSYDDDSDTTCNICGYTRSIMPPHSHDLQVVAAIPATCASTGNIEHYHCTDCGKLFNDSNGTQELTAADVTIGKLPHTPVTIPAVPATCEQSGMTEGSKCSVCQEVITAQTTIPALNHDWQPAVCETPETCTRCHVTRGGALGHDYSVSLNNAIPATCTAGGKQTDIKCSRCDDIQVGATIGALGHDWGRYTVTTPATETNEGVETRTCTRNNAHTQARAIPKLPSRTYGVSGEVHEKDGDPAAGVKVMLVLSDRQIASTTTSSDGKYSFTGVVPGVYNLVAEKGDVTVTVKVEVVSENVEVGTIAMPQGNTSSVVEVKSDDAAESVEAVVGNLEKVFEENGDDKPFTNEDKKEVNQGGSIEIKLTVTKKDTDATSDKIKRQLSDETNVGLRLELEVRKTVTPLNGTPTSTVVEDTDILLETIIRLPAALQGKDSYTVYRLHREDVQKLTAAKNDNGEFIEVSSDKTTITIHAKLYSEYVIAYQESSDENGGNGGSGGGDGSYTPSPPSNIPDKTEKTTGYRTCLKEGTCPIWPFTDAVPSAWYHDGVHYCIENGLMQGVSTAKFLPDGSTTRAQLVTILWRLEGNPAPVSTADFSDVADGAWYAKAVRWAAGSGVVKGYDNGNTGPDDAVTREQMVTILYRFAQHKGYDVSAGEDTNILSFNDALTVSEYAIPAMQWACGSGMVNGIAQEGEMFLAPKDTTTRAQIATLMMRFQGIFTTAV